MMIGAEETTTIRVRKAVRDQLKRIATYEDSTLFLVADDILEQALKQPRSRHPAFASPQDSRLSVSVRSGRKRS
jgi:hypothetical protein